MTLQPFLGFMIKFTRFTTLFQTPLLSLPLSPPPQLTFEERKIKKQSRQTPREPQASAKLKWFFKNFVYGVFGIRFSCNFAISPMKTRWWKILQQSKVSSLKKPHKSNYMKYIRSKYIGALTLRRFAHSFRSYPLCSDFFLFVLSSFFFFYSGLALFLCLFPSTYMFGFQHRST